jgi:lipopolysaccharide assembly outer membrane protein LptD (OstA)
MRMKVFFGLVSLSFLLPQILVSEDIAIDVRGTYLSFSYDYNQIYGENVELDSDFCHVYADYIKIDITSRLFLAVGNVVLEKDGVLSSCDEFLFNPEEEDGLLIRYKETIQFEKIGEKEESSLSAQL